MIWRWAVQNAREVAKSQNLPSSSMSRAPAASPSAPEKPAVSPLDLGEGFVELFSRAHGVRDEGQLFTQVGDDDVGAFLRHPYRVRALGHGPRP
jgi:hypothetical protein